jgi:SAM-dependent methyltransferase
MMERIWRLVKTPVSRRRLLQGAAVLLGGGLAARWLAERTGEPGTLVSMRSHVDWAPATGTVIDVAEFKKSMTVEALNETAEQYFAAMKDWDHVLAKPLLHAEDTPGLLTNFAHVLNGLQLVPGMRVLDFGAGTCWASRWLTQLGMEVVALDVSRTALKMGEALYARQPVFGQRPAPRFLHFDGRRIDLPDASVDRILCLDTFHHLLNPEEVLREMSRVLKDGGTAGFSEPGPRHAKSFQSQFEMRNFKVLEDDIDIHRIWAQAQAAGFRRIRVAVYAPHGYLLGLQEFDDYLNGGPANRQFAETTRMRMEDLRLFFLQKGSLTSVRDSRRRNDLSARVDVKIDSVTVREGAQVELQVLVTNRGPATWLPPGAPRGAVLLGCHLLDASGRRLSWGYHRQPLLPGEGRAIAPGETLTVELRMPAPGKGTYLVEVDLLSESVSWFSTIALVPPRVRLEVT